MSEIDWSKAPEWADRYGLAGGGLPVWFNDEQYEYFQEESRGRVFAFDQYSPWLKSGITGVIPRPSPAWSGEGLPPVGLKVRIPDDASCGNDFLKQFEGLEVDIIGHTLTDSGKPAAVFRYKIDGKNRYHALCVDNGNFEPIRTPEQIAAEERGKAVTKACADIKNTIQALAGYIPVDGAAVKVVRAMIDAGYRKQDVN